MKNRKARVIALLLLAGALVINNTSLTILADGVNKSEKIDSIKESIIEEKKSEITELDKVSELFFDDNYKISWKPVDNAKDYLVNIYGVVGDNILHLVENVSTGGETNRSFLVANSNVAIYVTITAIPSNETLYKRSVSDYYRLLPDEVRRENPSVEGFITEEPKTEEPKTEEPKTEEPRTEVPKTEEQKTEEPKTEEPKTEEPKTEEPRTEVPKTEESETEEPRTEEPKTEEPSRPAQQGPSSGDPTTMPSIGGAVSFEYTEEIPFLAEIAGGAIGGYRIIQGNASTTKSIRAEQLRRYLGQRVLFGAVIDKEYSMMFDLLKCQFIDEDLRLAFKKVELPQLSSQFTTLSYVPLAKNQALPRGTSIHFSVGMEFVGKKAYIFEISDSKDSYELKKMSLVNEIGNIAYEANEITNILIMIEK